MTALVDGRRRVSENGLRARRVGEERVEAVAHRLLAGHAASALISSKLYAMADRKLRTIEGFMNLLRVTQGGANV